MPLEKKTVFQEKQRFFRFSGDIVEWSRPILQPYQSGNQMTVT